MIGAGELERVEGYTWAGGPCGEDFLWRPLSVEHAESGL